MVLLYAKEIELEVAPDDEARCGSVRGGAVPPSTSFPGDWRGTSWRINQPVSRYRRSSRPTHGRMIGLGPESLGISSQEFAEDD